MEDSETCAMELVEGEKPSGDMLTDMDESETCVMELVDGKQQTNEKCEPQSNGVDSSNVTSQNGVTSPAEIKKSVEPRLMITHIENENFKSYAGKRTLGPFHKNFSSIVGPNGSGKSNVIDAMLFVFGYRANKIRSKKISVLIHNSENHKNINSCSVHVHFQKIIDLDGDEYEVVPNSKLTVSRSAYRDNSSNYYLNGKKTPFKEIAVLLRKVGIDLDHNRFLILQGEVEQISMMKPKALTEHEEGMLEYLEDIIGSSKYKEPIEELAKQVEELNEQRGEKLNRVKVVEKEKDELEGTKNEAMAYLLLENNISKKKNVLFQRYVHGYNKKLTSLSEEQKKAEEEMASVNKEMDEMTESFKEKAKEQKKIMKANEKFQKEAEDRKNDFNEFEKQDVKCRETLKHAKSRDKKLGKALQKEKEKLEELKAVPAENEKQIEKATKKREEFQEQQKVEEEKLNEIMAGLKTATEGLQTEKDAKEKDLMGLQKSLNEARSKMNIAKSEFELYKNQQNTMFSQLATAKKHLDHAVNTVQARKSSVQDLEKKIPAVEKELHQAKIDLQCAVEAEEKANESVRKNRVKVEETRSSLQSARSRGKVVDALMSQKKSGNIPGISGRLGDLGAIDEKYDVAISTACGALDYIVVDTMEIAQKCVNYLKKHNIGMATFAGLDKMKTWEKHASSKIDTPENVPRLFDLVKVEDKKVLTAFYFALRNTLVAKDLDQATRIAFQGSKRWRVVTQAGQLIDQSGTMSGGGKQVAKGRMGSSVVVSNISAEELEKMEKRLNADMKLVQHNHDNKLQLEDKVEKLQRSLKDMKYTLEKFNMDIKASIEQEATSRNQVKELEAQIAANQPDKNKLSELEKTYTSNKKDYDKIASSASKIEAEVQKLHKEIMDVGGLKLNRQQAKVDAVVMEVDKCTGEITKANVGIKNAERNIKKAESKVESTEKEIEENKEMMEKIGAEFQKLEDDATRVLQAYQDAQDKLKEIENVLEESKEELGQLQTKQNDLKKQHLEVQHSLEKWLNLVKENQQKIKHWKKETSRLTLHNIEGEEMKELPTLTEEDLEDIDPDKVQFEITVLEEDMHNMKPNMAAIEEYRKKGIVFSVRPPKKSWKNISNLSGGEKTLSSLALVFALHHFKPTPLYVMDEIDAALDFKNVSIVANYIKERTKNAQFIIISLRNNMFELADRLIGIYKTDNCTKSVTINPRALSQGVPVEC
uniref:Structural maintenance of chromosomes protein n=1 Tax=Saccoglossus kowalevskii TaxID=10224 RepID=A0ABM0MJ63_SACKO|nr:PREDICTED: structural maintenance of chromosomes protein 4-like [Saccoglossus kowalevskii]